MYEDMHLLVLVLNCCRLENKNGTMSLSSFL